MACLSSAAVYAADIVYISSSSGYMIHNNGGIAVTANWQGQAPIQGFGGYGAIHINGQCLTGRQGNQPLRWESCRQGDKSQVWKLSGGRLNNEGGWCADVEDNRGGAGVRVLAWQCSGAGNQRFRGHSIQPASTVANRIQNPTVRNEFLRSAQSARFGQGISMTSGKLIGQDGASLIGDGGGTIVAAGGGNIVAAGGGN